MQAALLHHSDGRGGVPLVVTAGVDVRVALALEHGGGLAAAGPEVHKRRVEFGGEILGERGRLGLGDGDAQTVVLAGRDEWSGPGAADDRHGLVRGGAPPGEDASVGGHGDRAGGDPADALGTGLPQRDVHSPVGTPLGHVGAHPVEGVDEPHPVGLQPGAGVGVPLAVHEVIGPRDREAVEDDGPGLALGELAQLFGRHPGDPEVGEQASGLGREVLGRPLVIGPSMRGEGGHAADSRGPAYMPAATSSAERSSWGCPSSCAVPCARLKYRCASYSQVMPTPPWSWIDSPEIHCSASEQ